MDHERARVLVLAAHPDDAEYHAGGLLAAHASRGADVRIISVTDGSAGHHRRHPRELAVLRRDEAREAGRVLGAEYVTWDFPDAALFPTLELRRRMIREMRAFRPDLILTHRTCDYHPDHRAVGQSVQDASYLVTVPLVAPDAPHVDTAPVVAHMCDLFTRPYPFRPRVVFDVEPCLDVIVRMLACHRSQVFEFLPYNQGNERVPESEDDRIAWLAAWYRRMIRPRADHFRAALVARYGEAGNRVEHIEAYEISEYAAPLADDELDRLFPDPASSPGGVPRIRVEKGPQ